MTKKYCSHLIENGFKTNFCLIGLIADNNCNDCEYKAGT
jgi:hypothetical protein